MAKRPSPKYDPTVGIRLNPDDRQKLRVLCASTDRTTGQLIRLLIRIAQPTQLQKVVLVPDELSGAEDGALYLSDSRKESGT